MKKKNVMICLSEETISRAKMLAKKENRSMSGLIENLILNTGREIDLSGWNTDMVSSLGDFCERWNKDKKLNETNIDLSKWDASKIKTAKEFETEESNKKKIINKNKK